MDGEGDRRGLVGWGGRGLEGGGRVLGGLVLGGGRLAADEGGLKGDGEGGWDTGDGGC